VLYFGSRKNGLWKSEDGAVTWKQETSFPDVGDTKGVGLPIVTFAPGPKGWRSKTIYVAASTRKPSIHRSQDGGATWKALEEQPSGFVPSHMEFDAAGTLYVAYGNEPGPSDVTNGAVYAYTPSTGKWVDITPLRPKG